MKKLLFLLLLSCGDSRAQVVHSIVLDYTAAKF